MRDGDAQQLVMVVLGSAGCGASRGSELLASMLAVRDSLRAIAQRRSTPFASIGVALDEDPRTGMDWLSEVGGFDEVAAGEGWINTAAVAYVWRDTTALAATPQVIVELRRIGRETTKRFSVPSGEVLIRMIGGPDISNMAGLRVVDSLLTTRVTRTRAGTQ
jgi:hypothetical protein